MGIRVPMHAYWLLAGLTAMAAGFEGNSNCEKEENCISCISHSDCTFVSLGHHKFACISSEKVSEMKIFRVYGSVSRCEHLRKEKGNAAPAFIGSFTVAPKLQRPVESTFAPVYVTLPFGAQLSDIAGGFSEPAAPRPHAFKPTLVSALLPVGTQHPVAATEKITEDAAVAAPAKTFTTAPRLHGFKPTVISVILPMGTKHPGGTEKTTADVAGPAAPTETFTSAPRLHGSKPTVISVILPMGTKHPGGMEKTTADVAGPAAPTETFTSTSRLHGSKPTVISVILPMGTKHPVGTEKTTVDAAARTATELSLQLKVDVEAVSIQNVFHCDPNGYDETRLEKVARSLCRSYHLVSKIGHDDNVNAWNYLNPMRSQHQKCKFLHWRKHNCAVRKARVNDN